MSGTIHDERFDKIVSLGNDCTVGLVFKAQQLKAETYPFDWIVSHHRWVRAQFEQRLPWRIDGDALEVQDPASPQILADESAGAYYYHDFTADRPVAAQLAEVQAKYRRRAERLNDLLDSGRRVLFLRTARANSQYPEPIGAGTSAQLGELAELIEAQYPNADFHLLMLYAEAGEAPTHPRVTRLQVAGDRVGFRRDIGRHVERLFASQREHAAARQR